MGIKWLTSFINGSSYEYEECQPKGIVIDGLSFIYTLSKNENISWMEGGRYWLLREKLIEFFDCLNLNHIEPIVVMDGSDLQNRSIEKHEVRIERREENSQAIARWVAHSTDMKSTNSPLPILSFNVFLMVTEELGVPVIFANGDADEDTVAIANYYNYPVLASDSDYYMYDIKAGYIPIDRFNWRAQPIKVEVYKLWEFNYQFAIISMRMSRVIPAVLGNDLIEPGLIGKLIGIGVISSQKYHEVESLVRYISKIENVQQLKSHIREKGGNEIAKKIEKNLKKAEEIYNDIQPLSKEDLQAKYSVVPDSRNEGKFPKWLMQHGQFLISIALKGSYLPRFAVIDDPCKPTARLASVGIRQSMYTMMSPLMKENRVIEYLRNKLGELSNIEDIEIVNHEVPILSPSPTLPSVLDIEAMSPDEKVSVFCHVLGIDRNILDGFDKKWKLVVAAACYWVKKCKPTYKLIEALAATFVQCSRIRPDAEMPVTNKSVLYNLQVISRTDQWLDTLHSFSCFQCIFVDTAALNDLLQGCLDDTLSPAFLFDGRFAITRACTNRLDYIIKENIAPDLLYRKLRDTMTSMNQLL